MSQKQGGKGEAVKRSQKRTGEVREGGWGLALLCGAVSGICRRCDKVAYVCMEEILSSDCALVVGSLFLATESFYW